jgi:rubrerythrin
MVRQGLIAVFVMMFGVVGCADAQYGNGMGKQRRGQRDGSCCGVARRGGDRGGPAARSAEGPACRGGPCACRPATATSRAPADAALAEALQAALVSEWENEEYYALVIQKFDASYPYENLIAAERRHAAAIGRLLDIYGVSKPTRPDMKAESLPATLTEATSQAIASEEATVRLYERLLAAEPPSDVRAVFERMAEVSRDRHVPALKRALDAAGKKVSG